MRFMVVVSFVPGETTVVPARARDISRAPHESCGFPVERIPMNPR
jgi:hypothetical protein